MKMIISANIIIQIMNKSYRLQKNNYKTFLKTMKHFVQQQVMTVLLIKNADKNLYIFLKNLFQENSHKHNCTQLMKLRFLIIKNLIKNT